MQEIREEKIVRGYLAPSGEGKTNAMLAELYERVSTAPVHSYIVIPDLINEFVLPDLDHPGQWLPKLSKFPVLSNFSFHNGMAAFKRGYHRNNLHIIYNMPDTSNWKPDLLDAEIAWIYNLFKEQWYLNRSQIDQYLMINEIHRLAPLRGLTQSLSLYLSDARHYCGSFGYSSQQPPLVNTFLRNEGTLWAAGVNGTNFMKYLTDRGYDKKTILALRKFEFYNGKETRIFPDMEKQSNLILR